MDLAIPHDAADLPDAQRSRPGLEFGQLAIDYLEQSTVQREQAEDYRARLYFRMESSMPWAQITRRCRLVRQLASLQRVANQIGPSEAGRLGETYEHGGPYWETDQLLQSGRVD